jgi:hypothetical protein
MLRARVPDKLKELVEKFRLNEEYYKSQNFLETQVRVEFINPLLRLLGWDVDNEAGYGHEYKDVIHEHHPGEGKHIDYVFKVGTEKKFLIEAKRPSEKLEGSKGHAAQAKAYAYQASIPLVVLTDFEELAIYQGYRDKTSVPEPSKYDPAEERLVFYCRYVDYAQHWSFLFSLLSKKSVMLGLHDHLLKRLEDVTQQIQKSVFVLEPFNLLYSIAQSFGGEDYSVEQDIEIHETGQADRQVHAADVPVGEFPQRSLRVTENSISQFAPAFYLKPLYS